MTEKDKLLKAKIPCPETGIECKHTFCSICEPLFHCGINAYVKDDKIIKVEGLPGFPVSKGMLCTKGATNRQFIYRKDRLTTPLKRVSPKGGEGEFVPITWDEAYEEIAKRAAPIKEKYGPESFVFIAGYAKWYRAMLQRLCHSFGSPNFGTESSTCHTSTVEAWKDMTGMFSVNNTAFSNCYILWAANPYYSKYVQVKGLYEGKARGMKIIVVDPRKTPSAIKLADLHLQIKPGTDAALAFGMAKIIIDNGWADMDYINKYVHGFEEYKKEVEKYDLDTVASITGLKKEDIYKAAEMYACNGPASISQSGAPIVHHINGYQTFKAIMSLAAITGNYDRKGGNIPAGETFSHQWAGFETCEHQYTHETYPENAPKRIGYGRFPLWEKFIPECQLTDLVRHTLTGDPYPLKGMFAFGFNTRMMPQSHKMLEALDSLDFMVSIDLFMTDACKHADIVLPACSVFEREEFKVYPTGDVWYVDPVIPPVGESRPDSRIISELVPVLGIDDPLLASGYRAFVDYSLKDCKLNVEDCRTDMPIKSPDAKPYQEYAYVKAGLKTPSGKFELYSETIASLEGCGLSPVPTYDAPYDGEDTEKYPLTLSVGARVPYALHSRLHEVPWLRSFHPTLRVDINDEDAEALGIELNDIVIVENQNGRVRVAANVTSRQLKGTIQIYHGRKEADANELVNLDHLCPYSGYPGYNCVQARVYKEVRDEAETQA